MAQMTHLRDCNDEGYMRYDALAVQYNAAEEKCL